jgi:type I site-specific restriction endonuclease
LQSDLAQVAQQVDEARQQTREEYDKQAAYLRGIFDDGMRAAAQTRDDQLAAIQKAEIEAVTEIRTGSDAERTELQKALAEAQAGLKRAGEVEALAKHLEEQRERLAQKAREADLLDQALKALDQLKQQKLDSLPIPGLEIRENEVYKNGIPFDQLNHAQRYTLAIEIGSLGMGDLPLVVSDEAEALDEKEFQAFCEAVKESGIQLIAARVDSGELRSEPQQALKL